MKVISSGRQTGKTTELVRMAAERGGYIVCHSQRECQRVFRWAIDYGIQIRMPITYDEFLNGRFFGPGCKEFYVDNVDMLLRRLARGVPVVACAISNGEREE